ncbi:MAG: gfo/Idh/MocA family oxidoreductase, partial [Saprospiraceae bacterium]|nr:gfo/Idh/MocA family oxidoreductase [Saprospiraceae bacterium]
LIPPEDHRAVRGLKLIYDNGIEMRHENFGRGWAVRFIGSEGSIDISRQFFESDPPGLVEKELSESDVRLYHSENHYRDWLDCMKSRERPICDVEVGHRSASVCNIANIAYQLGRPLKWNPRKESFKGDREANKLLGKEYRKPYELKGT